jgi:NADPH-dependent 2,4-dienoyl-CoA reductase/sulfur reductase-like enzyme/rhodanese-related sulfurtransferase
MTNQTTNKKILVIGGVALGAGVAAKARRMDENAEITIIEKGPYVSFANCGLPYYLGGVIPERSQLLLHTPESLRSRFNIDVRVRQEATEIDREHKQVTIRRLETGDTYSESYDKLVLAMGAKPILPPLPGHDLEGIFSIRNVPDVDAIKDWVDSKQIKSAVVIGAGFIGLETVENFAHIGLKVTLVEKAPQILPPFDEEMTSLALDELEKMGVNVILNDGITGFVGEQKATAVQLESGKEIPADMFIMGLGVRPDNQMAKDAGLEVGFAGAVRVNEYLQTSDPDIYSGGDLAEIVHLVHGETRWIPLAAAANKQGRIIGMNICGAREKFRGAQGTSIVRVGDVTLAMTGLSEKAAKADGIDFFASYNTAGHHAGYYPGAKDMTIKLLVEKGSGRVLGAQIVGREGVDKRIDVVATAIGAHMTVEDVASLDLAYAPPFSSAKDPIIMAAMAAENINSGETVAVRGVEEIDSDNVRLLDVRRPDEFSRGRLDGAINIPLDELRERADELDKDTHWVLYCRSGQRSYFASRTLQGLGFKHIYNLTGGYVLQKMMQRVAQKQEPQPVH